MAQPTNTFDSYDSIGNKDDLSEVIYNLSPTQTPFLSMAQRLKARNTFHEWQTDSLAAAAQNAVIEADDATLDSTSPTQRVGNYLPAASGRRRQAHQMFGLPRQRRQTRGSRASGPP